MHSLNFLNGPGSLLFKSVHVRSNQKGKGTLSSPVAAIVTEVLPSACLQKTYAIPRRKGRFLSVVLMSRVCLDSFGAAPGLRPAPVTDNTHAPSSFVLRYAAAAAGRGGSTT